MKKLIYFLIALSVLVFMGYKLFNQKEFVRSDVSPHGLFRADLYIEKPFFALPGGGGITSKKIYIEVFDKNDNLIGETNNKCSVFLSDVEIRWDLKRNVLRFAPARTISLINGRCDL